MGYIAPVNHYQYSQYAERELKNDYDPFQVIPIGAVKRAANSSTQRMSSKGGVRTGRPIKKKRSHVNKVNEALIDEAYSEITGKGRYFNECV